MTGKQHAADREQGKKRDHILRRFFLLSAVYCLLSGIASADMVHSRAAVVMDASTGKLLYAKNPDLRCPPASTTKLMTAILAVEHLNLETIVTISRKASHVSPHKAGFKTGERITAEELLYAALLGSANDAAVALAEAVAGSEYRFVKLMNKKALMVGAHDTRFINPHGLPGPGQYSTASDLSRIMQYALQYPKLQSIINTRVAEISTEKGRSIFLRNTNRLLWSEAALMAGKTGYTRKARHCFVGVAERDDDMVVVALLGSPSRDDLWKESGFLLGRGFNVLSNGASPFIYLGKTDEVLSLESPVKKKAKRVTKNIKRTRKNSSLASNKTGKKKKTITSKKNNQGKVLTKYKGKKKKYRVADKGNVAENKG